MSTAHGEQVRILEQEGEQKGRSLEWWGMVFFICSEALIFANFIAAYLYLEIRNGGDWRLDNILFPAINTVILLSSSAFAHMAGTGIRKGNQNQLRLGLIGTIVLGAIFLGGQAYEYTSLIGQGFTLSSVKQGPFGSAFYTLTGFHGFHVTIGVIFLLVCLIRSYNGHFTAKKHFAVEAAELYWHFVDGVWVFVFSLVYLLPLFLGGK
jgi:heme/copper-type cytochrome/quinol oxidase subunit 3